MVDIGLNEMPMVSKPKNGIGNNNYLSDSKGKATIMCSWITTQIANMEICISRNLKTKWSY